MTLVGVVAAQGVGWREGKLPHCPCRRYPHRLVEAPLEAGQGVWLARWPRRGCHKSPQVHRRRVQGAENQGAGLPGAFRWWHWPSLLPIPLQGDS